MSGVKGWFQGLGGKNKDEPNIDKQETSQPGVETSLDEGSNQTLSAKIDVVDTETPSDVTVREDHAISEMPQEDGTSGRQQGTTTDEKANDNDENIISTHVTSCSDQFLNMTAVALDATFEEKSTSGSELDVTIENDQHSIQQDEELHLDKNGCSNLTENKKETRLLMAEMMQASFEDSNKVSHPVVCL